ncbi:MAG: hypothetical protein BWK75_03840 [Candidatus Altiarchaeales archaeon A3]|nr:MAG: hypothetical protein BWK75_03840 [Candidatus Altiarchaeales archaeon A3]
MSIKEISSTSGSSPEIIQELTQGFIKEAINLVINGYENMSSIRDFQKSWEEPQITAVLIRHMREYKNNNHCCIKVRGEQPIYNRVVAK